MILNPEGVFSFGGAWWLVSKGRGKVSEHDQASGLVSLLTLRTIDRLPSVYRQEVLVRVLHTAGRAGIDGAQLL